MTESVKYSVYNVHESVHVVFICVSSVQTTKSGLVIPEKAQEKVNQATVVAVGGGGRNKVG